MAVDPADQPAYVRRDAEVWTAFLQTCPGFVRKEVWRPEDRPGVLVLQIWWTSREAWQAITPEQVDAVDARMGDLLRPVTARAYDVLAP